MLEIFQCSRWCGVFVGIYVPHIKNIYKRNNPLKDSSNIIRVDFTADAETYNETDFDEDEG